MLIPHNSSLDLLAAEATLSPMYFTRCTPGVCIQDDLTATTGTSLQIFSFKIAKIKGDLKWPLYVYGMVAAGTKWISTATFSSIKQGITPKKSQKMYVCFEFLVFSPFSFPLFCFLICIACIIVDSFIAIKCI